MATENSRNTEKKCLCYKLLTEEERRAIRNPNDCPLISIIEGLAREDLKQIYKSIKVKDGAMKHYLSEERTWLEDAAWYLGQKLGKDVREGTELVHEILERGLCEKFRLYYAVKFRDNIEAKGDNQRVAEFFSMADNIKGLTA